MTVGSWVTGLQRSRRERVYILGFIFYFFLIGGVVKYLS